MRVLGHQFGELLLLDMQVQLHQMLVLGPLHVAPDARRRVEEVVVMLAEMDRVPTTHTENQVLQVHLGHSQEPLAAEPFVGAFGRHRIGVVPVPEADVFRGILPLVHVDDGKHHARLAGRVSLEDDEVTDLAVDETVWCLRHAVLFVGRHCITAPYAPLYRGAEDHTSPVQSSRQYEMGRHLCLVVWEMMGCSLLSLAQNPGGTYLEARMKRGAVECAEVKLRTRPGRLSDESFCCC